MFPVSLFNYHCPNCYTVPMVIVKQKTNSQCNAHISPPLRKCLLFAWAVDYRNTLQRLSRVVVTVVQKKPKKRCTPSLWGQLGCYRSGCSLACFLPGASPLPASPTPSTSYLWPLTRTPRCPTTRSTRRGTARPR